MRNLWDRRYSKTRNTHLLFITVHYLLLDNRAVCGKMWKNVAQRGRPQMTIWRIRIACWIPKATNIHKDCVIHIAFPLQQRLHGRASMLCSTSFVCLSSYCINPLKPELNSICYLLALLGAHHFLHVSRIRVKLLTFRLLMSYIYGAPILDVSRSHTTTQHSR